jgi:CheY-like chemotaxis protein
MPEMDGIELVREVRKSHPREKLPILIITAKGEEDARGEGMALGANAYILQADLWTRAPPGGRAAPALALASAG